MEPSGDLQVGGRRIRPSFFKRAENLRKWLARSHSKAGELWVGFYKKSSGKPSITYQEALDLALCFGWIDGVRKGLGDDAYTIRFSPRGPRSNWSRVNIQRFEELQRAGLTTAAGRAAFEAKADRVGAYSYEESLRELSAEYQRVFKRNPHAWKFFQEQPPSYRRTASWWVMSAKREETRLRRLGTLVDDSAAGRRLAMLARPAKKG